MHFVSRSPEQTAAAGRELARVLAGEGLVIALDGPLGAGKTVFVKGLAEGMGIDPGAVASPSFTIASQYEAPGGRRLAHVDVYRLESGEELLAAGFLDLLEPGQVVAVEWAGRFPEVLPAERLEVRLERGAGSAPGGRVLHARASGGGPERVRGRWAAALGGTPEPHPPREDGRDGA